MARASPYSRSKMRTFRPFSHKKAHYRILNCGFDAAVQEIIAQRSVLERFIKQHFEFRTSFEPLPMLAPNAPNIVRLMHTASMLTGVGPMAAVAGGMAEFAVRAALKAGCEESIVENGGDIFLAVKHELVLGIYAQGTPFEDTLAFKIQPKDTPLSICSSSSTMGHSISFGNCDLVTVFSKSGTLADATATLACNMVKTQADMAPVMDKIMRISGILGIMLIKDDRIGMDGDVPELIRNADPEMIGKVTRDKNSNFRYLKTNLR